MSLRDYFAAKAMVAFISRGECGALEVAPFAYRHADQMLKERKR